MHNAYEPTLTMESMMGRSYQGWPDDGETWRSRELAEGTKKLDKKR